MLCVRLGQLSCELGLFSVGANSLLGSNFSLFENLIGDLGRR
jgi:hypothetical protein